MQNQIIAATLRVVFRLWFETAGAARVPWGAPVDITPPECHLSRRTRTCAYLENLPRIRRDVTSGSREPFPSPAKL